MYKEEHKCSFVIPVSPEDRDLIFGFNVNGQVVNLISQGETKEEARKKLQDLIDYIQDELNNS